MAAFDLNSLYFLKNNAPKTSDFNDLVKNMEDGFALGNKYTDSYNRNSLQNLIAQREQEGVPYYMLGNEAAKWNLDAAQSMDKDRIGRIEFDYRMKKDEFDTWRKTMARRICGLILQKADELGTEDRARVLDVAASYVVTYDPELAQQLRSEARVRTIAKDKLNKPVDVKDHELQINNSIDKMSSLTDKDLQSNPRGWAEDSIRGHAGKALHRYKSATGNYIHTRQMAVLENIAQQMFPGWEYAGSAAVKAMNWLDGLSGTDVNGILSNYDMSSEAKQDSQNEEQPVAGSAQGAPASKKVPDSATPESFKIPRMWSSDASGKKIPANGGEAQEIIDNANDVSVLKKLRKALQDAVQVWTKNDNDAAQYNNYIDQINEKIKELEVPVSEKIRAKFDAGLTGEMRTALSTQRNSFTTALSNYNTGNYMAAIGPILRASNPQERSTDQDVERAMKGMDQNTFSKIAALAEGAGFKDFSKAYTNLNAGEFVYQLMLALLMKQRDGFQQQLERVNFANLSADEQNEILKYLSDQYQMPVSKLEKIFEIPGRPKPKNIPWKAPDANGKSIEKMIADAKNENDNSVDESKVSAVLEALGKAKEESK